MLNSAGGALSNVFTAGFNAVKKEWEDQETSFVMDFMKLITPKNKK